MGHLKLVLENCYLDISDSTTYHFKVINSWGENAWIVSAAKQIGRILNAASYGHHFFHMSANCSHQNVISAFLSLVFV